jgi:hypothetical protein
VVAPAATGEQEDEDGDDDQGEGAERGQPGEPATPSYACTLRRNGLLGRRHVRPTRAQLANEP